MELSLLLEKVKRALDEPGLCLSEPWTPFKNNFREIRFLSRPSQTEKGRTRIVTLGEGSFGIVFAVAIRVPGELPRYMPAAMKMAALLDDHVTEVINGMAINELLDAGVSPGLCYLFDAFTHSTSGQDCLETPKSWDDFVWGAIDKFMFQRRHAIQQRYGPNSLYNINVPKETARAGGGYTFGYIFVELLTKKQEISEAPNSLLGDLYVRLQALQGLAAVGMHHCDISSRNWISGKKVIQSRGGIRCLLRHETSASIRDTLYGATVLRFGVDHDEPLAFSHVSNSFELAREDPSFFNSYTRIDTEETPVLIDFGKSQRAEFPAGLAVDVVRQNIIARRKVKDPREVPTNVISFSPLHYDHLAAFRGSKYALGSNLSNISILKSPTTAEQSRSTEQLNPFVLKSATGRPYLVMHSDQSEIQSAAIVFVERVLGFAPFGNVFPATDTSLPRLGDPSVPPPPVCLPLILASGSKGSPRFQVKGTVFKPEVLTHKGKEGPMAPGFRRVVIQNGALFKRVAKYIRAKVNEPHLRGARCDWFGYSADRSSDSNNLDEPPSDETFFYGAAQAVTRRIEALGVPDLKLVTGTFFYDLFKELRVEEPVHAGWLKPVLELALRSRMGLPPIEAADLLFDLTMCLSWDPAHRPPVRRLLRNPCFRRLHAPLDRPRRLWSAEVPSPVIWPSRPRDDGSNKLALVHASEVTYSDEVEDRTGGSLLPSVRYQMACRPVAAVSEFFQRHAQLPGFLLKDHRYHLPMHSADSFSVAVHNFNTGLLDYYDGGLYKNFATGVVAPVGVSGLRAAFGSEGTLRSFLELAATLDCLPEWLITEDEEDREEGGCSSSHSSTEQTSPNLSLKRDSDTVIESPITKKPRL